MTTYVFAPPPQPFLPVKGTDARFPVHRIYCVGQNYADHAIEMGGDPTRNPPFFFLQAVAKKAGRPWEVAKAFEHSAPCSAIVPVSEIGHPEKAAISLAINGETRQSGDLNQMIWKVAETISYLSSLFELQPGDLIFTGTPAGVGPVKRGDRLEGKVDGVATLTVTVV